MRTFEYLKPTSITETRQFLDQYGEQAKVIAGGNDRRQAIEQGRESVQS